LPEIYAVKKSAGQMARAFFDASAGGSLRLYKVVSQPNDMAVLCQYRQRDLLQEEAPGQQGNTNIVQLPEYWDILRHVQRADCEQDCPDQHQLCGDRNSQVAEESSKQLKLLWQTLEERGRRFPAADTPGHHQYSQNLFE